MQKDGMETVSVNLRERDMDVINEVILIDVDQARMDLADWWIGDRSGQPLEVAENERMLWRDTYLKGAQEALILLKEVNTAFISAGAPPRSSYTKYFEKPSA